MISRRRFLQAAGGIALPFADVGWRAALGSSPELPSPAEVSFDRSEPGLARGVITAAPARAQVDGRWVSTLAYDGVFPGPLLRIREGETVQLQLRNRLPHKTNLHFHGLSITPGGRGDNVWIEVPPGESFDYEFTVPKGNAGLHWYHPHIHGDSAVPMFRGLAGPILVEADHDFEHELDCDDRICVLKDVGIDGDAVAEHRTSDWYFGKEGNLLLVNGVRRPVIRATRSLMRLRLLNASNARYWRLKLSTEQPFHVIAHDGCLLDAPREADELILVPGSRAEILVMLEPGAPVDLLYLPTPRRGLVATPVQPILTLEPPPSATRVVLPSQLESWTRFDPGRATVERDVILSIYNICGRFLSFDRVDIEARAGAREIWNIRNVDVMDHPFHLHTWHYEVLDVDGRAPPYPIRHDMFNVREGETVRIGVHFVQHTGRTFYHCHFAEHSDQGMMAILQVA
ncbi:MAG: multicopper oxidase family protein [Burkholderiales bacterium]|nr:multicopper oxidase family protein [Burkholderiales bacterium]